MLIWIAAFQTWMKNTRTQRGTDGKRLPDDGYSPTEKDYNNDDGPLATARLHFGGDSSTIHLLLCGLSRVRFGDTTAHIKKILISETAHNYLPCNAWVGPLGPFVSSHLLAREGDGLVKLGQFRKGKLSLPLHTHARLS